MTYMPIVLQNICMKLFWASLIGSFLISIVHFVLNISIYGTYTPIFIYSTWMIMIILSIQFLYKHILSYYCESNNNNNKITPLNISKETIQGAETEDGLHKIIYTTNYFMSIQNTFLLRYEYQNIPSFHDLAIILFGNTVHHDNTTGLPNISSAYDVNGVSRHDILTALGYDISAVATETGLDNDDHTNF